MKRYLLLISLVTLTCVACRKETATPPDTGVAGTYADSITIDGHVREFIVSLPEGWNNMTLPLVFALHGGAGTADGMETLTGFRAVAMREKFILVYPQGIEKSWNDGRATEANQLGIDDVKFFSNMINHLSSKYKVNAKMIFCTGISNGGFMTSTLAFKLNAFAACAVDAASIDSVVITGPSPSPVSMMLLHGTTDPIVPFIGGTVTIGNAQEGLFVSHARAVQKWVQVNQCTPSPAITNIPDNAHDGTTIIESAFTNGKNNTVVTSYVINNGGHTWPGGYQYLPELVIGKTTHNLDATELIWRFFKSHPKP